MRRYKFKRLQDGEMRQNLLNFANLLITFSNS